ncbi:PTS sugar transporter subunit IIA [Amphibacillus sp. Q70]|uniref:PTS sugar transporter subunit IIA n=1 Tax=Amphibacillus sp. Q70 TaxID=3453416 RepID=UPI003F826D7A
MSFKEPFLEVLVQMDLEVENSKEFLKMIGNYLQDKDYVKETFISAIQKRENEYPTGLQLENFAVAIPHTDAIHIKKPFVAVNRLVDPVVFFQMGTDDVKVPVRDILVLGIKDPENQVGLLQDLMKCFSDQEFIQKYKSTTSKQDLITLIKSNL